MSLRFAVFCHSLVSDWNHGNAHFLRGIVSELQARGNQVQVFEPEDGWSRRNLIQDHGNPAVDDFHRSFPRLSSICYDPDQLDIESWLQDTDLILVHEWNDPRLVSAIGQYRRTNPLVRLLFHDTHHRAVTAPEQLARFDLAEFDGILVYGRSLKEAYQRLGWGKQVHVWHEAADTRVFHPIEDAPKLGDLVWIGNWGDEERTEELREYFINPCAQLRLKASAFGVRYPEMAIRELEGAGVTYKGWLANYRVPRIFAQFKTTIHIPRRPYTRQLPGIPTIRPFESLACGIPLISSPWSDTENLFRIGVDFLVARNGAEMRAHLQDVLGDSSLASSLSKHGLETIRSRHTCGHRVNELLTIYDSLKPALRNSEQLVAPMGSQL
ncbi:MAG: glycosyltransferase [Acidobacteriaceae bacterium]|nr:glycosyltransferase [Acidobacteriaceae bacterium]